MIKHITYFITAVSVFAGVVQCAFAQIADISAQYMGHSLSDPIIDRVNALAAHHPDVTFSFKYQTNPGSSLKQSWEIKEVGYPPIDPYYAAYYDTERGLAAGGFNVFVMTESVPRLSHRLEDTHHFADSFYTFAVAHNPGIQVYLYEIWHCIHSGTPTACEWDVDASPWRERLADDLPMWESIVDSLNRKHRPEKPVRLIPGGQGMAALYDAVMAGKLPGVNSLDDLFTDDIHISGIPAYLVACVHFATLYDRSPIGLPHQLTDMWGRVYEDNPTPEQARIMQEIAWEVVQQYNKRTAG